MMKIADIRIDGGTQSRVEINTDAMSEYADAIHAGAKMPPVTVFFDGVDHWLADGFHRVLAHFDQYLKEIEVEVITGSVIDAKLYAYGANQHHGLRRSNADKRKAVEGMLEIAPEWSDNQIAKHVGVSVTFVGSVRRPEVAEQRRVNRDKSNANNGVKSVAGLQNDSEKGTDLKSDFTTTAEKDRGAANSNGDSPRIESDQQSSSETGDDLMSDAEAAAYVDDLHAQIDQLQRSNDALSASDQGAELMKQMQLLLNAENALNTERERAAVREKSLKWFGRQYAELRNILDVKNDRDVLAAVRKLLEVAA